MIFPDIIAAIVIGVIGGYLVKSFMESMGDYSDPHDYIYEEDEDET